MWQSPCYLWLTTEVFPIGKQFTETHWAKSISSHHLPPPPPFTINQTNRSTGKNPLMTSLFDWHVPSPKEVTWPSLLIRRELLVSVSIVFCLVTIVSALSPMDCQFPFHSLLARRRRGWIVWVPPSRKYYVLDPRTLFVAFFLSFAGHAIITHN